MKILSKKLMIALMAFIFIFSVSAFGLSFIGKKAYANDNFYIRGNGSKNSPYEIGTAEQLAYLAQLLKNGSLSNINLAGEYIKLIEDIDLESYDSWTPIGTIHHFGGNFDGDGHIIKNIRCRKDNDFSGLFGVLGTYATVKNIYIESGKIEGNYSGGITGTNWGVIENCFNKAEVRGYNAGGIAGINYDEIKNCFNAGYINGNSIGGIAGKNSKNAIIKNCYNTNLSSGNFYQIDGRNYAGGIAGENLVDASISNCYSAAGIYCNSVKGSIAGSNAGMISNCISNSDLFEGGMVGDGSSESYGNCSFLATSDMTADGALDEGKSMAVLQNKDLSGKDVWFKRAADDADKKSGYIYYPELSVFAKSIRPKIVEISKESVSVLVGRAIRTGDNVIMADWTFNETASEPNPAFGNAGSTTIRYEYEGTGGTIYLRSAVKPQNAGTYKVVAIFEENQAYYSSRAEDDFEIYKAAPSYTIPTGLTAKVGDTLSSVVLPDNFNWKDDGNTLVGNAGSNKFTVIFTPNDTDNYNVKELDVTINVSPNSNSVAPDNATMIGIIIGCIALASLGAVLMVVFISKRKRQKLG